MTFMVLNHVRMVFLLLITITNGWNLTNYVINVCILTCYKTSLDFVNISESVIHVSGKLFFSCISCGGICVTLTYF